MPRWPERTLKERLIEKIKIDEKSNCWIWIAAKYKNGYGAFGYNGKTTCAHRFSYEAFVDSIPEGYEINHICKNILCINPEHLEALSRKEHMQKDNINLGAWQLSKTHCPYGHKYTPDNIKKTKKKHERTCLTCHREKNREYMRRKRTKG